MQKYLAVQSLFRRNPWGMDLDDPSIASRFTLQTLDVQMEKSKPLFNFFQSYLQKGLMPSLFNNVILDPPKKKVMLYIYSPYFLENLAGVFSTPPTRLFCCQQLTLFISRIREERRYRSRLHAARWYLAQVYEMQRGASADLSRHTQVRLHRLLG